MNSHLSINRRLFRLALRADGVGALCIAAQLAYAAPPKISPDLKNHRSTQAVEVIVQYKVPPTENHQERAAHLGGVLQNRMDYIKAAHYIIPASALDQLSADPDVQYISPNRPLRHLMDIPAQTVTAQAASAAGYDGTGIGVAVIDSGIGLAGNFKHLVYQASFVTGKPPDEWGHGTHVAGLIAGTGSGTIYTGIAPNVEPDQSAGSGQERQRNRRQRYQCHRYGDSLKQPTTFA